jgi:hypothetical protein
MTKEEIKAKMEEISYKDFILKMKDMWNDRDYDTHDEYNREYRELERQLERMGDE